MARAPKIVGKFFWNQRLVISATIEGTLGVALVAIGILAFLGIVSVLSIGQIGSITLLAVGGVLLSLALLSLVIKGGLMIKKRISSTTSRKMLHKHKKITGSDPQMVFLIKFKNIHFNIEPVINQHQSQIEMKKFEKNNPTDDYRIIKLSYQVSNVWIIGVATKETSGEVQWHRFKLHQMEWRAEELTLTTDRHNQLFTSSGPIKSKIDTQDLLDRLTDTIYEIIERKTKQG